MRLIDVPMLENDVCANTIGEFLKILLLQLWEEADEFSGKRPFGNSDWQYQVYASLIAAGYEVGELDEDGYVEAVDYAKADRLVMDAIREVFDEPVKHGRWIEKSVPGFSRVFTMVFVCSECEKTYRVPNMNYCPNCGARMNSEETI